MTRYSAAECDVRTREEALDFLDRRYAYTAAVAQALTRHLPASDDGEDDALYGVWLGPLAEPVYIGQTEHARRRLWDLPVGESHHLANSFPPETWGRVVVVRWHDLVERGISQLHPRYLHLLTRLQREKRIPRRKANLVGGVGLAFEYLLQREYNPVFNATRKQRDGTRKLVHRDKSRSVGAVLAPHVADLFEEVHAAWRDAALTPADGRDVAAVGGYAHVVFPQAIRASMEAPVAQRGVAAAE